MSIYGKCHDHGAKYHKWGTKQQAQGHINAVLHLVDVTGHPCDQRRGSYGIDLRIRQSPNMGKQVIPQCSGCSRGCLGCKILGCQGTGQSNSCKEQKKTSHAHHIRYTSVCNTYVYHTCHY